MSKIPNFSKIELDQNSGINNEEIEKLASINSDQDHVQPWETAEKISINNCYTHKDLESLDGWPEKVKLMQKYQSRTATPIKI